jgi:CheY-like chemotaxis protein
MEQKCSNRARLQGAARPGKSGDPDDSKASGPRPDAAVTREDPCNFVRDGRRIRVLIVEDDFLIAADLTTTVMEHKGEVAGTVGDQRHAAALALKCAPDVVLMDIQLRDGGDGIRAAEAIRMLLDVPIIFCTGNGDTATLERIRNFGAAGLLLKPTMPEQVCEAILAATCRSAGSA